MKLGPQSALRAGAAGTGANMFTLTSRWGLPGCKPGCSGYFDVHPKPTTALAFIGDKPKLSSQLWCQEKKMCNSVKEMFKIELTILLLF